MKGLIHGLLRYKGRDYPISIEFGGDNSAQQVIGFMADNNIEPLPMGSNGSISLVPMANKGCPEHGAKSLKDDNKGKGQYCSAKVGEGYCSRKSWKSWKV
jgi:hypothetical protein